MKLLSHNHNIHTILNPCRNSQSRRKGHFCVVLCSRIDFPIWQKKKKREILYIGPAFTEASFLSKDVTMQSKSSMVVVTFTAKDNGVSDLLSTSMVRLDGIMYLLHFSLYL